MSKPLTIYKASAGSGKTFTLAVEYIKLLIRDPQNFRYTLAVTFTNKATEEMKTRILGKLYGIANSLPDADDYMEQVSKAFRKERAPYTFYRRGGLTVAHPQLPLLPRGNYR